MGVSGKDREGPAESFGVSRKGSEGVIGWIAVKFWPAGRERWV